MLRAILSIETWYKTSVFYSRLDSSLQILSKTKFVYFFLGLHKLFIIRVHLSGVKKYIKHAKRKQT